jgi:hypothetical protein
VGDELGGRQVPEAGMLPPDIERTQLKSIDREGEGRSEAIVIADLVPSRDLLALEQADHIGRGSLDEQDGCGKGEHCDYILDRVPPK